MGTPPGIGDTSPPQKSSSLLAVLLLPLLLLDPVDGLVEVEHWGGGGQKTNKQKGCKGGDPKISPIPSRRRPPSPPQFPPPLGAGCSPMWARSEMTVRDSQPSSPGGNLGGKMENWRGGEGEKIWEGKRENLGREGTPARPRERGGKGEAGGQDGTHPLGTPRNLGGTERDGGTRGCRVSPPRGLTGSLLEVLLRFLKQPREVDDDPVPCGGAREEEEE